MLGGGDKSTQAADIDNVINLEKAIETQRTQRTLSKI
jgi:putative component of toxin-antitoxin plasmid stabilization module